MCADWANPSSEHDAGYELYNKIRDSRQVISDFLDCSTREIFFTSGATESINTILSESFLRKNRIKTIITSRLEHHATLDCLKSLAKNGFETFYISNNSDGIYDLEDLERHCRSNPNSLVSLLYVNNETGVINDIREASQIAKRNNCLIHVDAVQALGKLEHSVFDLDVDFASYSGHKIGSFKGVGVLYARDEKKLSPLLHGGGQERSYRPGTYNFPAIRSLELAVKDIDFNLINQQSEIRAQFENQFLDEIQGCIVVGNNAPRVYNTSNLFFRDANARSLLLNLSREGVFVSTGSACSSGSIEPSHVLINMGMDKSDASACLRFSIGVNTSLEELNLTMYKIKKTL
jgi:cysteine desulfurase